MALHGFFDEFQRRSLVPGLGHKGFEDLALMVDGAPEVLLLAIDSDEQLVEMPPPMRVGAHLLDPPPADLTGEHRAKAVPPETDWLLADVDAAYMQQIRHIVERQQEPGTHHNRHVDDFRRRLEVLEWVAFCHSVKLGHRPARLNKVFL